MSLERKFPEDSARDPLVSAPRLSFYNGRKCSAHKAALRLSAFNQRTTPERNGEVSVVSADTSQDQKTGASFYIAKIALPDDEIARLGGLKLVPGMPLESFIQTGERTALSYLTKPLADQVTRAWREK